MTINAIRYAMESRIAQLSERYEAECMKSVRTKHAQAVYLNKLKKDICSMELVLDLADRLALCGHGKDEVESDNALLGVARLVGRENKNNLL